MGRLDAFQAALRKPAVRSISRRYFVSNGFDGTLTSIGVATGAYLSGVPDGRTVVLVGVGGAVGLCTSGVWSVWEIERAEKISQRRELEQAMLRDLEDTHIQREDRAGRVVNALASGLGPLLGTLLPLVPFLLEGWLVSLLQATLLSVGVGVGLLFVFGAYMGSIAELNWTVTGVRMALAGVLVAAVNVLLPG
ncbi:VIT1/CCC1 transporter family protein [Haloarchaeobius sp. DT45]|uniref:VIT1/CCC1 transporter family protein n=1 Tax=Haloarchaeobius sp. DT45 TaxID=3446116 RepID=UPI003F6AB786